MTGYSIFGRVDAETPEWKRVLIGSSVWASNSLLGANSVPGPWLKSLTHRLIQSSQQILWGTFTVFIL